MLDLHCHLLPGIDDGAADLEIAEEMLHMAVAAGTTDLMVTPHYMDAGYRPERSIICAGVEKLQVLADRANLKIRLHPAMEVYLTDRIVADYLNDKLLTLGNTNYLLVELPSQQLPRFAGELLFELTISGLVPVIAHPERNKALVEDPNLLVPFLDRGILCQVNAGSITGLFGPGVRAAADTMLAHGMVHFLGSDAHSNGRRSPDVSAALTRLRKNFARQLQQIELNGKLLLEGGEICSEHLAVRRKKFGIFGIR